jgi:hypothetical protein
MDFFTRFALFHKSKVTISQMPAHQNLINPIFTQIGNDKKKSLVVGNKIEMSQKLIAVISGFVIIINKNVLTVSFKNSFLLRLE